MSKKYLFGAMEHISKRRLIRRYFLYRLKLYFDIALLLYQSSAKLFLRNNSSKIRVGREPIFEKQISPQIEEDINVS